jgi:hypothetical protein
MSAPPCVVDEAPHALLVISDALEAKALLGRMSGLPRAGGAAEQVSREKPDEAHQLCSLSGRANGSARSGEARRSAKAKAELKRRSMRTRCGFTSPSA